MYAKYHVNRNGSFEDLVIFATLEVQVTINFLYSLANQENCNSPRVSLTLKGIEIYFVQIYFAHIVSAFGT